jgi:FkbM family methyltransferase
LLILQFFDGYLLMGGRKHTWRHRSAETLSNVFDFFARIPGRRFYALHLEAAARRYRREMNVMEIAVKNERIKFRTPGGKALWRAETLLSKEPATIGWIDTFDQGDVFWDVGANIGIYSLYATTIRGVETLAFEPASFNYALLCDNAHLNNLNGRIAPYNLAFSAQTRLGRLKLDDDEPGIAFATVEERSEGRLEEAVLVFSVDDFIARFSPPFPTHIKIDVDGSEEQILEGATRTFADLRLKSLLIEVDEVDPQRPQRVDEILGAYGFTLVDAQRSPLAPDYPARNRNYRRL